MCYWNLTFLRVFGEDPNEVQVCLEPDPGNEACWQNQMNVSHVVHEIRV